MNKLPQQLELLIKSSSEETIKSELLDLFINKRLNNPYNNLGRIQPYELVVDVHHHSNTDLVSKKIKELLHSLLLEYYNTSEADVIYHVLKCFQFINYTPFLTTARLIIRENALNKLRYNDLNLELVLISAIKKYKLDKRLKSELIFLLEQNSSLEYINKLLDLFITREYHHGINRCFAMFISSEPESNTFQFAAQYVGSYENIDNKSLYKQYLKHKELFATSKIDSIYLNMVELLLGNSNSNIGYLFAIKCLTKASIKSLTIDDYTEFAQTNNDTSTLKEVDRFITMKGYIELIDQFNAMNKYADKASKTIKLRLLKGIKDVASRLNM